MPSSITNVSSPSHPLEVQLHEGEPARATITLGTTNTTLDKDLVLLIGHSTPFASRLWVERQLPNITTPSPSPSSLSNNNNNIAQPPLPSSSPSLGAMAVIYTDIQAAFPSHFKDYDHCEFVFLVDQSGSMAGSQIQDARHALQLMLRSLPVGCLFNIVGFGSKFVAMSPTSLPYNQANLDAANMYASNIEANLGGTELLPPLQWILRNSSVPTYPRQIFVITDGQISNTQEVLDYITSAAEPMTERSVAASVSNGLCSYKYTDKQYACQSWWECRTCNLANDLGVCLVCKNTCHAGHDLVPGARFSQFFCDCGARGVSACRSLLQPSPTPPIPSEAVVRVFSVGIGSAVSHELVRGLARAGRGTHLFVMPGERLEAKIIGQLALAMKPSLPKMEITWNIFTTDGRKLEVKQGPSPTPPIFHKTRMLVFGLVEDLPQGIDIDPDRSSIQLAPSLFNNQSLPPATIALGQAHLRQTDDSTLTKLAAKRLVADYDAKGPQFNDDVVRLSLSQRIVTPLTSFVAVEKRRDPVTGTMQSVVVPSALPQISPHGHLAMPSSGGAGYMPFSISSAPAPHAAAFAPFSSLGGGPSFPHQHNYAYGAAAMAPSPASSAPPQMSQAGMRPMMAGYPQQAAPSFASSSSGALSSAFSLQPASLPSPSSSSFHSPPPPPYPAMSSPSSYTSIPGDYMSSHAPSPTSTTTEPASHRSLRTLVQQQTFQGSWQLTPALATAMGATITSLQSSQPKHVADSSIWGTALAIAFLEGPLALLHDRWQLVVQKARTWLSSVMSADQVDDLIGAAALVVAQSAAII
eukprot:TRINITY_DN2016_c0_g1_i1.p1 TRINITY_DN2016_c0_g1~~TRINITY_DN2016_c0_g1_i1.p1  ORF type:complete len:808 (+),score=177.71 TRINITY_DN2016_c0_g1_i1:708-3131(+)